jgi:hypothetical protein
LAASDPVAAARIDPGNVRRTVRALEVPAVTGRPFSTYAEAWDRYDVDAVRAAGLRMPREALLARIGIRVRSMLDEGWLDEVRSLLERGFGGWLTSTQAIGYAEMARHLRGEMTREEAVEATVKRTGKIASVPVGDALVVELVSLATTRECTPQRGARTLDSIQPPRHPPSCGSGDPRRPGMTFATDSDDSGPLDASL